MTDRICGPQVVYKQLTYYLPINLPLLEDFKVKSIEHINSQMYIYQSSTENKYFYWEITHFYSCLSFDPKGILL